MKHLALVLFAGLLMGRAFAQAPPEPPPAVTIPVPLPAPTMLPKYFVSAGGGYATPGGKFAYVSESSLVLPQQTYATVAQEYTIDKNHQVQSCTFVGISKPMYQLWGITLGVTGLGGGCTSSSGDSSPDGSGQIFLNIPWWKLAEGNVITFRKNTNSGWKVTLGFSFGKS